MAKLYRHDDLNAVSDVVWRKGDNGWSEKRYAWGKFGWEGVNGCVSVCRSD